MSSIPAPRAAGEAAEPRSRAAPTPLDPTQAVPAWARTLLGLLLIALGLVLLYLMIALWPAVQAAATNADSTKKISWFGWSYRPTADAALIILVVLVSALGSYVHVAVSFSDYVGNRQLARSWVWWYLLRVFVGCSLALLFYFAVRGGFFGGTANSSDINPYGIAALSGIVGLFSKQATDKLREVFDTAFRVAPGYGDDARANSILHPVPELEASEPERLTRDDVELTLIGSGFVDSSIVRVTTPEGRDVQHSVKLIGPQRLKITLEAADAGAPGQLLFTVVNPEPGGGTSRPLSVFIDAEAAEEGSAREAT
jgi:hypothetical protein